jgi:hypothetical protein
MDQSLLRLGDSLGRVPKEKFNLSDALERWYLVLSDMQPPGSGELSPRLDLFSEAGAGCGNIGMFY